MKKLVEESFNEYVTNERLNDNIFDDELVNDDDLPSVIDDDDKSMEDIEPSAVEDLTIEDEREIDDLVKLINNEIDVSFEADRLPVTFKLKSTKEIIQAVPMARLGDGTSFLFKMKDGTIKKIKLEDISDAPINEDIDIDFVPDALDKWQENVWNHLITEFEMDVVEAEILMDVSEEALVAMFEEGMDPSEAAAAIIAEEEPEEHDRNKFMNKFMNFKEPEESYEEESYEGQNTKIKMNKWMNILNWFLNIWTKQ